jgi:multidrug transporter EmrE-like cation transporter
MISSIPLLCALGAGLANTVVALSVKAAQHSRCRPSRFLALAMIGAGTISMIVAGLAAGSWSDWRLWTLGIVLGGITYGCVTVTLRANRYGPPSLPWAMANLGLILPIGLSAIFLSESLHGTDMVCLVVFGGMLLAFVRGTTHAGDVQQGHWLTLILLVAAVWMINGTLMFGFKLNAFLPGDINRSALTPIVCITAGLLAWLDEWHQPREKFQWRHLGWSLAMGFANGTSILLLLMAMKLPASVAFPIIQGVSFLGGIVVTAVVFHERLNLWKWIGITFGLAVICLAVRR